MKLERSNPLDVHPPAGQYSHLTKVPPGTTLIYIAGQVGADRGGRIAADFGTQMHQAWRNLEAILAAEGLGPEHLVHINSYVVGDQNIPLFRQIRSEYLPNPPPSSTTLLVPRLISPDWLFEVDGVAACIEVPDR